MPNAKETYFDTTVAGSFWLNPPHPRDDDGIAYEHITAEEQVKLDTEKEQQLALGNDLSSGEEDIPEDIKKILDDMEKL